MLKKIRDFIYDINDIFVAIVILLAAAGIIIWRSTAIMAYPDYLAAKNPESNSVNVDFSGIDLTPENVDDINQDIEIIEPNTGNDAPDEGQEQQPETTPEEGTETPPDTTPEQGTETPPDTTPEQNGGQQAGTVAQDGKVTATVFVDTWGNGERWTKIADKLAAAGLIGTDETDAFVDAVNKLGYSGKLQPGTYELTNTSFEDMIKVICHIK